MRTAGAIDPRADLGTLSGRSIKMVAGAGVSQEQGWCEESRAKEAVLAAAHDSRRELVDLPRSPPPDAQQAKNGNRDREPR